MIKKEMIAMLLAGGQGSRLGVLTDNIAKPAVDRFELHAVFSGIKNFLTAAEPGHAVSHKNSLDGTE